MTTLSNALCARPQYRHLDWHSEEPEEQIKCKSICSKCPDKVDCAQLALDQREAWGIWGGMDDFRMRRALGLDALGRNRVYTRDMVCPFCFSDDLDIAKKRGPSGYPIECNYCSMTWCSYRVPDKIKKTLKRKHDPNLAAGVGKSRSTR